MPAKPSNGVTKFLNFMTKHSSSSRWADSSRLHGLQFSGYWLLNTGY
jgi:hypothetical protein